MKYMMKCPMCEHMNMVDADDDDMAMMKLKDEEMKHMMETHKDAPAMSEEEIHKYMHENMKKE